MASSFQLMLSSGSFDQENKKKKNMYTLLASRNTIDKIENVYRTSILRGD